MVLLKYSDAIMQIVNEGLPFSHVTSDEYRRMTCTKFSRQDIADEIKIRADAVELKQFEIYPVVPNEDDFMTRVQALLIWDGFMCTQHRHTYLEIKLISRNWFSRLSFFLLVISFGLHGRLFRCIGIAWWWLPLMHCFINLIRYQ
ncbi:Hypothetical_protein [Hexamita inflata]|uniref:Hypothetical_protein n=1 Tax=Hexamita inflata TaxID=28002 RepID=A0AA86NTU2_9EUKA|nr:Hypothetical protein HINF_LOCUS12425 [Hexamita inflata]